TTGDAEVEQPLLDVTRNFLWTKEHHAVDPWIVDGSAVVALGSTADTEVSGVEQFEGGALERAFGQHEREHSYGLSGRADNGTTSAVCTATGGLSELSDRSPPHGLRHGAPCAAATPSRPQ